MRESATTAGPKSNGERAAAAPSDWPRFRNRDLIDAALQPLHALAARAVVRDRWEWLVTQIDVPHGVDEVWRVLTDPEALRRWLAVCHGSLEQAGRDTVLDFEDGEFFLCRSVVVQRPHHLEYVWRWLGIGQATSV